MQAIGYRQIAQHLRGQIGLDRAIEGTVRSTRRFAKRQSTWFRAEPDVAWFEAGDPAAQGHATRLLTSEDLMLQPYLTRVETEGELSAVFIDGQLTHGVRKVPVPGDYRVQDDFGAKDYLIDFPDVGLARRTMDAAGRGLLYGRADFLIGEDGLQVTELELVEPSLFFRHCANAADVLADALVRTLRDGRVDHRGRRN